MALFSIFIFSRLSLPPIPAISLEPFYPNISQITYTFTEFIKQISKTTLDISKFIDPVPPITIMLQTVLAALIELDKIIGSIFSATINLITFIVQKTIANIQNRALYIANAVSAVIILIIDIAWMLITQIYYISHVIILTIAASIAMIINKINEFLNQMLILIRSPFIKLGKDLEAIKPFIDKLTTILANTADYFITTANTVFKLLLPAFKNILKSSTV